MKLISMVSFVIQELKGKVLYHHLEKVVKYADFLSQKLELCMFVPCKIVEGVWVVLEEPNKISYDLTDMYDWNLYNEDLKEYQEAKDRVIFEGFCIMEDKHYSTKREIIWMPDNITQVWRRLTFHSGKIEVHFFDYYDEFNTVEDLVKYNLELTPTAQKQIGLI